jgi:hypothetical protein
MVTFGSQGVFNLNSHRDVISSAALDVPDLQIIVLVLCQIKPVSIPLIMRSEVIAVACVGR